MKRALSFFLVVVFILLVAFIMYVTTPEVWPRYEAAQTLIRKIEVFKKVNSRLPESMEEITPKYWQEEGPIYYEKKDENSYIVSFGIASVGESYVYDSKTKEWH